MSIRALAVLLSFMGCQDYKPGLVHTGCGQSCEHKLHFSILSPPHPLGKIKEFQEFWVTSQLCKGFHCFQGCPQMLHFGDSGENVCFVFGQSSCIGNSFSLSFLSRESTSADQCKDPID